MTTKIENADDMTRARHLAGLFGGRGEDVDVPVGNWDGWTWADASLAAVLKRAGLNGNPYEYGAYDAIVDEWTIACDKVEADKPGSEQLVRLLLDKYSNAIEETEDDGQD